LVWAYADGVLEHLAADLAGDVSSALSAYLDGDPGAGDYADGYVALAELAGPHVTGTVLDDAYARSRRALENVDVEISAPDGLAELLAALTDVHRVVVTNAPATGLDTALQRLGLSSLIDEIVPSGDKPAGSRDVLTRLLAGAAPAQLMSVGDIWRNDIAPALELGAATAFIDRLERDGRQAHVRGTTIQQLYPAIREWAAAPPEFIARHQPDRPAVSSEY
jgi:FMN phosphatase YigB (HAD superfamily)